MRIEEVSILFTFSWDNCFLITKQIERKHLKRQKHRNSTETQKEKRTVKAY